MGQSSRRRRLVQPAVMIGATVYSFAYNIPVSLLEAYRGRKLIVRARESSELVESLAEDDLEDLLYVRLLSLDADVDALANWGFAAPVEVALDRPATDYPKLYRRAKLLDKHPVRISMPVAPGFSKAVKVAAALNFAIRLEPAQPAEEVMNELFEVLDLYLHRPSVTQPVEFFQSLMMAFYDQSAVTLWAIQEEDPALVRYITDDGVEIVSPRFAGLPGDVATFLDNFRKELLSGGGECCGCEFWEQCCGYFKWPRREFACHGVKAIFSALRDASEELRKDVEAYIAMPFPPPQGIGEARQ
jgi:hypothetical protein